MAKNRIIYAILAIVCLVFSIVYKSNFSAVLLIAVLMYLPIAAIFTAVSLCLADVRFLDDNYVGEKNTGFEYELEVINRFIMPFVPLELLGDIPDGQSGVFIERRIFVTLEPFGKTTLIVNGTHKYRGQYKSKIKRIYTVDPFGIIRFSRKINREMTMIFLPRRFMLEDLLRHSEGETSVYLTTAKKAEREDFSHVRDYREGDILQLVHWKLTAKSDSVMIKEFESISDKNAKIFCDFNSCKEKQDPPLSFDTVIETALAFAKSLISENIGVAVDFGDFLRNNLITVKSDADYERLYGLMALLETDVKTVDIDSMLGETREDEQSVIVIITAKLTEQTVYLANSAANLGAVIVAFVNLENISLERDYSEERFSLMNILEPGKTALKESASSLRKGI